MLKVEHLSKCFGAVTAVEDVNLTIGRRERIAILGESGSGKSTLLLLLAGLLRPDNGIIYREEKTLDAPPHLRGMAMAFQEPALWNHMTVRNNILFGCTIKDRVIRRGLVEELAAELGIAELLSRFPSEISGGQARRVAIARALCCGRELLLLDEAFSNLDEETKAQTIKVVLRRCENKSAVLLVTHDPTEAVALCETRYRMAHGRLTKEAMPL